ncbi:MAG TPA: DinB family protein [Gemmatimonadales bacterium]|nr:DinB family protein [Gemmatimonadales bacterium]
MTVVADLNRLLLRELATFRREVELFPDDASLWRTAPGVTNSAGNLALHIAGNLRHFVGTVLGGTGYVRNRDAEFGAKEGTRASVVQELEAAESEVAATLAKLDDAALQQAYTQGPKGVDVTAQRWLIHLASHAAFHLGQAGYLRRIVTGNGATADTVSVKVLNEP